jgi:hypothetical protein
VARRDDQCLVAPERGAHKPGAALSVLGEGSFLALLAFLERHAPDPVAARITHLARAAIERRHDALVDTAGLNADALVVLAAGGWTPDAIGRGHDAVQELHVAMDDGRRQRLARLGFPPDEAAELSALHTRNFV